MTELKNITTTVYIGKGQGKDITEEGAMSVTKVNVGVISYLRGAMRMAQEWWNITFL